MDGCSIKMFLHDLISPYNEEAQEVDVASAGEHNFINFYKLHDFHT